MHNTIAIPPSIRRLHFLLLLLFTASGCEALIYEVSWFQILKLVIGSSAVSLGVLLGTYMGGTCLGSLRLPRFLTCHAHPLRAYAGLALGLGTCVLRVVGCAARVIEGSRAIATAEGASG